MWSVIRHLCRWRDSVEARLMFMEIVVLRWRCSFEERASQVVGDVGAVGGRVRALGRQVTLSSTILVRLAARVRALEESFAAGKQRVEKLSVSLGLVGSDMRGHEEDVRELWEETAGLWREVVVGEEKVNHLIPLVEDLSSEFTRLEDRVDELEERKADVGDVRDSLGRKADVNILKTMASKRDVWVELQALKRLLEKKADRCPSRG